MHHLQKILLSCFLVSALNALGQNNIVLPEVEITQDRINSSPVYNGSATRLVDVIHTELELQLDWSKHAIDGRADIYLTAYNKPQDSVVLDAKGFKIHEVSRVLHGVHRRLEYTYKNNKLSVAQKVYKDTVLQLHIHYTALPDSLDAKGSAAIIDAKGFYFIDETEEYGRQFWTQGEPESNSAWFPTVDKPNERITTRIGITVDNEWQTLSNGRFEFRTLNEDGTRTDYWLMEQPHAPYLVMLAGGVFDTIGASWNGIPIRYFVEPDWAYAAGRIFANTPEMLSFFSKKLGVSYPWPKYDQIVVRNFVSGAMENTSASLFGEFMYTDNHAFADETHEDVIAHELFHQWFGDLVTCESWAQLPLNESFATYGEVIWKEYKYGTDAADFHAWLDLQGYLYEFSRGKSVNMIRFNYNRPDDMFDSHSYAKGGRILHLLRHVVGDDDFFASLKHYLTKNAYKSVEIHDLRLSFEHVTGQDLNWFFDQWFFKPGHPQLRITHGFDRDQGLATMKVEQLQDPGQSQVYRLPTTVDVYTTLGVQRYNIEITKQVQEFSFPVKSQPSLVHFDPENYQLAEVELVQPDAYWMGILGKADRALSRYKAAEHLIEVANDNLLSTVAGICMRDKNPELQELALRSSEKWDENGKKKLKPNVEALLQSTNPDVRAEAITAWATYYEPKDEKLFEENLKFVSYRVNEASLKALINHNPSKGIQMALDGLNKKNDWAEVCLMLIAENGNAEDLLKASEKANGFGNMQRLYWYYTLSQRIPQVDDTGKILVDILVKASREETNERNRMYAAAFLTEAAETLNENLPSVDSIKRKELKNYIEKQF